MVEWNVLAGRDPSSLAVALPDRTLTASELEAEARVVAAELVAAGVGQGDRVVVALPASVRFVAAYLAVRLLGAVFVNVPWQWRRELVAVAEETDARAVLLDGARRSDDALEPLGARLVEPGSLRGAVPGAPVGRSPDDVAWLAYTSGTTGLPKGAVHTEATLALTPKGFRDRYGLGPDDALLVAAPVGHAVGFVYGVALALHAGCPLALVPRWDARAAATLCARHGCTFTAAPTPFLHDAVELAEAGEAGAFASLRLFLSGGAAVPPTLLERAWAALPSTATSAYFGTSECGAVSTCPPGTPAVRARTSVGLPLTGMEVAVDGGELLVRGSQLARGYWAGDSEGKFRSDGWFATGDLAELDGDGYVRIAGRLKEVIRRGGVAVSPTEVEDVLAAHPGVREAAVVGIDDARLGELVAAAVVPRGAHPTLEELREGCRVAGLASVKWPEVVVFLPELARSPAGKLLRGDVLREVEARR